MNVKLQHLWRLARITEAVTERGELSPIDEIKSARLQAKRSYWLNKQIDAIAKESIALEQSRLDLFRKHGTETGLGNGQSRFELAPGSDAEKAFLAELTPLLEQEVEIPGERFNLDELGSAELSPNAMDALGFLFTENE